MWSARTRRLITSTGARLAVVQAALVIVALALAGYLTQISTDHIFRQQVRERVLGEIGTLHDEIAQRGATHLFHTIAKRSRQSRGFDYRLTSADGRTRAGDLVADGLNPGWAEAPGDRSGRPVRPRSGFLVHTERLADGSMLSVAEDLSGEAGVEASLTWTLFWCGALGAAFCLSASYVLTRGVWRDHEL